MISLKTTVEKKTEAFLMLEKNAASQNKVKSHKQDLEQAEVAYYEANLSYNIMIIHLAYETIEAFKVEKRQHFKELLTLICQTRIL